MFGRDARNEGFERVVGHYDRLLLGYVLRIVGREDLAEDIVQDAFIRLSTDWKEAFEPSPQMTNWLHQTAHNLAIDALRRSARLDALHRREAEERGESVGPAPGQGGDPAAEDAAEQVREALDGLSERERYLVMLKVYEEKSYRDIAVVTGLSVTNVGYILHVAMKKLATRLAALRKGEERP